MVRLAGFVVCLSGLLACAGMAVASPANDLTAPPPKLDDVTQCALVQAGKPIKFDGRTLIETPDLPPELRLINALVTQNCVERARQVQNQYVTEHPDDYRMSFINARIAVMMGDINRGQATEDRVLREHPDFSSMLVLRASLALGTHDYTHAQQMLDQVNKLQPQDLWAYIDDVILQATLTPSPAVFKQVKGIIQNTDFPVNVRKAVYGSTRLMAGLEDDQLFSAMMENPDTASDCVLAERVTVVIEIQKNPQAGASLIEDSVKKSGQCLATPMIRTLLAEAYLLQAAQIAPQPTVQNQALVQKALKLMNGDLTEVARRAAPRTPTLDSLAPFFKGNVNSRAVDEYDQTTLCAAVVGLNPAMAKEELENGADANVKCEHFSLVKLVLTRPLDQQHIPQTQAILRLLLAHGAEFDAQAMNSCASLDNPDCGPLLLPILQEFDRKRAQTRTSL